MERESCHLSALGRKARREIAFAVGKPIDLGDGALGREIRDRDFEIREAAYRDHSNILTLRAYIEVSLRNGLVDAPGQISCVNQIRFGSEDNERHDRYCWLVEFRTEGRRRIPVSA
ncbi:MAG: hypothetical protein K2Y42_18890 [Hyphomicrobium sp.]|uniref:hypothetical protein n=1 Tax=Hyphomicrobium sp. TaxID=82 RepID=UPI0025C6C947|nr:hypothetical protein [Hyphomicrobium sp.]MBX9864811.1 hypothetical protein [Hyphomicrobium sp.]